MMPVTGPPVTTFAEALRAEPDRALTQSSVHPIQPPGVRNTLELVLADVLEYQS